DQLRDLCDDALTYSGAHKHRCAQIKSLRYWLLGSPAISEEAQRVACHRGGGVDSGEHRGLAGAAGSGSGGAAAFRSAAAMAADRDSTGAVPALDAAFAGILARSRERPDAGAEDDRVPHDADCV